MQFTATVLGIDGSALSDRAIPIEAKVRPQVEELNGTGAKATMRLVTTAAHRPAHAIAEVAEDVDADLIAVATRGHAPVAGLLLGSVTQRLLHITPCPVLAVPPPHGGHATGQARA